MELNLARRFATLDKLEPQERYEFIPPVIMDILMLPSQKVTVKDYETGYIKIYNLFKEKCLVLTQGGIHHGCLAYSIVSRSLAWLAVCSTEQHIKQSVANQQPQIEEAKRDLKAKRITKKEHDKIVGECEERINNLPSDRKLHEARYNCFCDLIKPFLTYPPAAAK